MFTILRNIVYNLIGIEFTFINRCVLLIKSKRYKACEIKIMEARRFQLLSDEDLERLYDKSHNKNTVRGTNTWVNNLHSMGSFQEC